MGGRIYSPSPPRGGHGRRGRSPSPRGRYGGNGGRRGRERDIDMPTSLLVRNLRHDCRPEDLRRPFGQFGPLKDIYLPRDYYSGCRDSTMKEPRGFGFVQFLDPTDAAEAKYQMDGQVLQGRQLTVVFAEENRKKPTDMRTRERRGGSGRFNDRRRLPPPRYSRSPPPRYSRSPPPLYARSRSHSREYSPPPKRKQHARSISPGEKRRPYSQSPVRERSPPPRSRSQSPVGDRSPPYNVRSRSQSPLPPRDRRAPREPRRSPPARNYSRAEASPSP